MQVLHPNIVRCIADVLGNSADRDTYQTKGDAIKMAINSKLLDTSGRYIDGLLNVGVQSSHMSQHANMFPLALGIVPLDNLDAVITAVKDERGVSPFVNRPRKRKIIIIKVTKTVAEVVAVIENSVDITTAVNGNSKFNVRRTRLHPFAKPRIELFLVDSVGEETYLRFYTEEVRIITAVKGKG